jgi:hypothetical protein
MSPEEDLRSKYPVAAHEGTRPRDQWPVDVQRTDASGEFDLEQIEYNLSLTPAERLDQAQRATEFIEYVREAGKRMHGLADRDGPPAE